MQFRTAWLLALTLAMPMTSFADFRYDETSRITGGSIVNMTKFLGAFSKNAHQMTDPVNSTVLVKGNRMAHINQQTTEIIDLDKETVTNIDHTKKTYTVVTFQEMKAAMEEEGTAGAASRAANTAATPATNWLGAGNAFQSERDKYRRQQTGGWSFRHAVDIKNVHGVERPEIRANRKHGHEQRHVDGPRNPGIQRSPRIQ